MKIENTAHVSLSNLATAEEKKFTLQNSSSREFLQKNFDECKKIADSIKSADEVLIAAVKKYNEKANAATAKACNDASAAVEEWIHVYNMVVDNVNESMSILKSGYDGLAKSISAADAKKAKATAKEFYAYNEEVKKYIKDIEKRLAGCPHA